MDNKRKFWIFCVSMIFGMTFWRVIFFLRGGEISVLRAITGLNFHHYTYGILMILIASLIFIFYKVEKYSITLMGLGFGSFFDGFVSRLIVNPNRGIEIANYNLCFWPTIFLFIDLTILSACFYLIFRKDIKR